MLTFGQVRFGVRYLLQALLPLLLEAARDQAVLGIHGTVATFSTRRSIAGTLDSHTRLGKRGILIGF